MNIRIIVSTFALAVSTLGCNNLCGDTECRFTEMEWSVVKMLSPLPELAPDPTNKYANDPAAVTLGQKLFFEQRYSGGIKIDADPATGIRGAKGEKALMGCAACHSPSGFFNDDRSKPGNVSVGVKYTSRNTPTVVNAVYYEFLGWGGKQDSLWCQASLSPESGSNSAGNRCGYAHMLFDYYRAEYDALFDESLSTALSTSAPDASRFPNSCKPKSSGAEDGAWEMMAEADRDAVNRIMSNQGKAVAAYESKLVSANAPFDLYVAGDTDALSDSQKRGLKLFIGKAACVDCHSGSFFTDFSYHNIGVPQAGPNVPDEDNGRFSDIGKLLKHTFNSKSKFVDGSDPGKIPDDLESADSDLGKFRTATLRNVERTGPYMHNGYLATLRDVVEFYNRGGEATGFVGVKSPTLVPLNLEDREVDDLVAFLESLSGEPIRDEYLVNPFE